MWGSSFCSLTAVGRRVPRRKNRCGQGEKSVPPLTISARACIGLPIRAIPPVEIGDSARSAESPMCRALPKPCMPGWVRSRLTVNTASRQPFMSRPWVSSHLREKSSRGNPTPRFPMPPQSYVIRKKQHEESSDREVVVRYEALRLQLSQLSALGLLTDEGWKNEPSHAHLWLSWRHLSRALFLLARCGARCLRTTIRGCLPRTEPKRTASHPSSPSRRSPLPQNKFDKLGGRIDADASDTPDVDELWATKGIVLPGRHLQGEMCAHARAMQLRLFICQVPSLQGTS